MTEIHILDFVEIVLDLLVIPFRRTKM